MRLLGYEVICKSRKQRETLVLESAPFSFFATNIVSFDKTDCASEKFFKLI